MCDMKMSRLEERFTSLKEWYVVCFLAFLTVTKMVSILVVVPGGVDRLCYLLGAAGGGILCFFEVALHMERYRRTEYYLLGAFAAVCLISSALNLDTGWGENFKFFVWTAIEIFLMSSLVPYGENGWERGLSCLKKLMHVLIVLQTAGVVVSLGQFFVQSRYLVEDYSVDYPRRQGFFDARLFGIFKDPNYAAVLSLIIIIFCLFLRSMGRGGGCCASKDASAADRERRILREVFASGGGGKRDRWYTAAGILNLIYILLSGSRTAAIVSVAVLPVFVWFLERDRGVEQGVPWKKRALLKSGAAAAILLASFTFGGFLFTAAADQTVKLRPYLGLCEMSEMDITLERKDTQEDISNNRLAIWKNYLELAGERPVFGLSPANMVEYAKKYHPDSYIAETKYMPHSAYVSLLAGTGAAGLVPIAILAVVFIRKLCKFIRRHREKAVDPVFLLAVAVAAVVAMAGVFLLEIFFIGKITITTVLFWMFFGIAFWRMGKGGEAAHGPKQENQPVY